MSGSGVMHGWSAAATETRTVSPRRWQQQHRRAWPSARAELLCVAKTEVICLTQFPVNNDLEFNFAETHSVIAEKHL